MLRELPLMESTNDRFGYPSRFTHDTSLRQLSQDITIFPHDALREFHLPLPLETRIFSRSSFGSTIPAELPTDVILT
jgi:hypothetical protein